MVSSWPAETLLKPMVGLAINSEAMGTPVLVEILQYVSLGRMVYWEGQASVGESPESAEGCSNNAVLNSRKEMLNSRE